MISIGLLAKKYGRLPSEIVERATTFDLMVTDVLATWESHTADPSQTENYDENQLENILKAARG